MLLAQVPIVAVVPTASSPLSPSVATATATATSSPLTSPAAATTASPEPQKMAESPTPVEEPVAAEPPVDEQVEQQDDSEQAVKTDTPTTNVEDFSSDTALEPDKDSVLAPVVSPKVSISPALSTIPESSQEVCASPTLAASPATAEPQAEPAPVEVTRLSVVKEEPASMASPETREVLPPQRGRRSTRTSTMRSRSQSQNLRESRPSSVRTPQCGY